MSAQEVAKCSPGNQIVTEHCESIVRALALITDKWTLLVVRVLGGGPYRFNALRREVDGISQKVLANTLRDLEMNGLVSRTVQPSKPPQVAYALTPLGEDFANPVRALSEWVIVNREQIDAARANYAASVEQ